MNLAAYLKPLTGWKFWKEMITITVAMAIAAAAVYYFLMPGKLIVGSISGLSIVISGIFEKFLGMTVKVSVVVFIINAILLLLAWFLIGKEFGLKTAYAALVLAPLIEMWEKICPYEKLVEPGTTSVMGDIWFDLICFILILSASQAILFRINASTGGLDIIAKIVNKYLHYDMGMSVTIAGVLICCTAFAINPFRLVVIGLIGTWMNGLIVDYFMISLAKRKRVCIISEDYERIRDYIINTIVRGCSLYEVTGGYSGRKTMEIQSLLTQDEFVNLMGWIRTNDIKAFITAGNVSEVYGIWSENKSKKKKISGGR
ncbi:MAG: YitT family protein [Bacteroidales bacterium]|nr:YitT family protein [Bacteroidales bacterium]MDD6772609.1 YitT family protein [Bacteroidales bacterium]MDO4213693.1 YitT family protein [Bacteroidales bacterium]